MNPFTALPVWALFLTTVAFCLLAVEAGYRSSERNPPALSQLTSGMLKPDGPVNVEQTRQLVELAGSMSTTFLRAFDMCSDPVAAPDLAEEAAFASQDAD